MFFFRGLPGTGKTTLCSTIRAYGKHLTVATVSRDIIRERFREERGMKEWDYAEENESFVSSRFHRELLDALANPKNDWILVDNTNLSIARAFELASCIKEVNSSIDPTVRFKVVLLQLGGWMSRMRQHPQISETCEQQMRKTMGDDGLAYFKLAEVLPNWWVFMSKSYGDISLCSGFVPFDWKWKVPGVGGWTKTTTDILCNYFDPTLEHKQADFRGLFFQPYKDVFHRYFSEE